jgi:parvulin-like peptidyl-prolyl isomerase
MAKKPLPYPEKKTVIKKHHTGRYIGITLGILIILVALIYLIKTEVLVKTPVTLPQKEGVAASVGTSDITLAELNTAYERLPEQYKAQLTRTDVLKQLIDEKLLLLDAEAKKITVSEADVQKEISALMVTNNITEEEFNQALALQGVNKSEFLTAFKNRLLIAKLFNVTVLSATTVTTQEAKTYYDENQDIFTQPASVHAAHILVNTSAEADEIVSELSSGKNFTDLAKKYSIDPSAKVNGGDLGYFSQGMMVPAFEEAAFATAKGKYSDPVQTQFGWHIIWVIDTKPAQVILFDDIKTELIESLRMTKARTDFQTYLSELGNKTKIVTYFSESITPTATMPAGANDENIPPEQLPVTSAPAEEQSPAETPTETAPAETTKPAAGTLAACLTDKDAILYGAYWNKDTEDQMNLFGTEKADLPYVECGVSDDYAAQKKECKDEKILGYPTWKIAGKLVPGILTKEQVKALAGC